MYVRGRNKLRLKHPKLLESTLWLKNFFRGKKCCKKPEEPLLNAPHPLNKNVEKSDGLFEGPFQDEMFQGWLGLAWAGWKEISALKVKTIQDLVECIIHFAVQPIYLFQQTHCKLVLQKSKITAPPNASTSSLVPPSYPTRATIH